MLTLQTFNKLFFEAKMDITSHYWAKLYR